MAGEPKPVSPGTPESGEFKPYISASDLIPEFTLKAILLGAFFGILFGAATVYLGLKVGLTVSASIPIAVLAISVFKKIGKSTILENNIVQTIGSAGESVAAGVVFTIPALMFLTGGIEYFKYFQIFVLALAGGVLGVLFMIPLRRYLIVKEHGKLPYPEGTACAEVLVAGEKGGELAQKVFLGLGIGFGYKLLMNIFGLWKDVPTWTSDRRGVYPNMQASVEITPELMGVGYIIGPRIAGIMVAGGVLSAFAMVPLITMFGDALQTVVKPGIGDKLIHDMSFGEIRSGYVRYIGAGAVAFAGIITLIKTLPTIYSSFRDSARDIMASRKNNGNEVIKDRTEIDIPVIWTVIGAVVLVGFMAIMPNIPVNYLSGILIVVFGFFFVTVSSRIVGLIGSSSNPISGMTIATLMGTCLVFVGIGWTGDIYQPIALVVGSIVCIAAANAGATSQDLKTGYIVGATPYLQQIGLLIGVLASVTVIGFTMLLLNNSFTTTEVMKYDGVTITQTLSGTEEGPDGKEYFVYHNTRATGQVGEGIFLVDKTTREIAYKVTPGIGSPELAAPQATLMATIIKGMLNQELPWGLIILGMMIALVVELMGVPSLPFAVGSYLPLSTTAPIFIGGLVKYFVDKARGGKEESEVGEGTLLSSGLIAGGALTGILIAVLRTKDISPFDDKTLADFLAFGNQIGMGEAMGVAGDLLSLFAFACMGYYLYKVAVGKKAVAGGK